MDTDSPWWALLEESLEDIILPEKRDEWNAVRSGDCTDTFTANATDNFSPRMRCTTQNYHDKKEPGLVKEEFRCTKMLCLCFQKYCCHGRKSSKYKFSSKDLNKRTLEDCDDGPMSKNCKVLDESVNITPTNRSFQTV